MTTNNIPSNWNDFNDAESQSGAFDLIPKGTIVPVRMTIRPGGYDDPAQGWTGGYASESFETGSVYLSCEYVVLTGDFAKRKIWSLIGLHSRKGPTWGQMGRSFIRAALDSARNVHPKDNSPQANDARRIQGFQDLDGIEFLARIDIEKDGRGDDKNVIHTVIEPDHPQYAKVMGVPAKAAPSGQGATASTAPATMQAPATTATPTPAATPAANTGATGKPAWAQ